MPAMTIEPNRLSAKTAARPIGVDKEKRRINGMVVALAGPFKSPGRGEFDLAALAKIVELSRLEPKGLKSRLAHATMSDDGVAKYLGRVKDLRLDKAVVRRDGEEVVLDAVRGDLHLADAAFDPDNPEGSLGGYVLNLAAEDPDALSSSLVLETDKEFRLNKDGTRMCGPDGEELPPLWRPTRLHGADVVSVGDAVDGLLSAGVDVDGLPLSALWRGCEMLDRVFAGQPREVIESRCLDWLNRYLDMRFGPSEDIKPKMPAGSCTDIVNSKLVAGAGITITPTVDSAREDLRRRRQKLMEQEKRHGS